MMPRFATVLVVMTTLTITTMAFTTTTTITTTVQRGGVTATASTSRSTSTTLFVSAPIDPTYNKTNDKFFFAFKMNQTHDDTAPAKAVTTNKKEYFRDRIAFARQRALMASLAKNRQAAKTSTTTLNVINKKEMQETPPPVVAPPTPPTTPLPMDQEALQARQSYFKERIQRARQRALMANIATAKQAQTRTTDTLQKTTTTSTTSTTKNTTAAAPSTTTTTTTTSLRTIEARQRALLAAQLAYNSPALKAQRQRQAYFKKRIQASRQRALLASIAGAVANKQSLTTDTLKSSNINVQRSKRTEAAQRSLLTARLQQLNNSNINETTTKKQPQPQPQKPAFQISSRKVQMDRQAALLQEIQAQMSQTTKQRIMGNKAARKAARMANRQARKEAQQQQY